MAKNLRRQKIEFLPCAFLVSRHGMFKIHLSQCVFLVFWRCVFFAYVWCICDAIFAKKMYFFTRLAPVSRPGVFFLRLGHLRLVQVYLFYACVEIGLARLLRVYFLTRTLCIFFGKCIFGLHLWKQKSHSCCKCILAAHVFLRSSVLLILLR